jgi:hypothetical protein
MQLVCVPQHQSKAQYALRCHGVLQDSSLLLQQHAEMISAS